jgi:hypothetical protein
MELRRNKGSPQNNGQLVGSLLCFSFRKTILSHSKCRYIVRGKRMCVHYEPKSCIAVGYKVFCINAEQTVEGNVLFNLSHDTNLIFRLETTAMFVRNNLFV